MSQITVFTPGCYMGLAIALARDRRATVQIMPSAHPLAGMPDALATVPMACDEPALEVVSNWRPDVDCIILPDVGLGRVARLAQYECSESVIWTSAPADIYELDRAMFRQLQHDLGLPVMDWTVVTGVGELIPVAQDMIRHYDGVVIKPCGWRGTFETMRIVDPEALMQFALRLRAKLGPVADRIRFMLEQPIQIKVEAGIDAIIANGEPVSDEIVWGVEIKNTAYYCEVWPLADIPVAQQSLEVFRHMHGASIYTNFYSTEVAICEGGRQIVLEPTLRAPSPPYQALVLNMSNALDVFLSGGLEKPQWIHRCAAIAFCRLSGPQQEQRSIAYIRLPEEWPEYVVPELGIIQDRRLYIPTDGSEIALAVVAHADTAESALQKLMTYALTIEEMNPNISVEVDAAIEAAQRFRVAAGYSGRDATDFEAEPD